MFNTHLCEQMNSQKGVLLHKNFLYSAVLLYSELKKKTNTEKL